MSDGQAEQLEQPALIGVAEALTEHASATIEQAHRRYVQECLATLPVTEHDLDGSDYPFRAGWRAALEWYIGLGLERILLDAIEQAYQEGRHDASSRGEPR